MRTDPAFRHKVENLQSGETLKFCYQCGICSAACPISRFIKIYRPNKILELAKLGIRGLPQSSAFLFCSACTLCTKHCPQGVKVHEVMQALKDLAGEDANVRAFVTDGFSDVLDALGEGMPLPATYGWICMRPGEGELGAFILEAFDRLLAAPAAKLEPAADAKPVAVIGSGPAGLTAAWALAKAGLKVTLFEAQEELGGMLKNGIPSYRLPKDVVDKEIGKIAALGVEMRVNAPVDKAFFDGLLEQYAAVFISTGAMASRRLRLEGEELPGVVPALDFLKEFNLTGKSEAIEGKKVVVIGGGNVATDAAGAAIRAGAASVRLFCLEDRAAMPAHEWEIEEIVADGVGVNPAWGPKALLNNGEKITGAELVQCVSVFDQDGRFNPKFNEKKTQAIEADTVITAIGQAPDLGFLNEAVGTVRGAIEVDPYTLETGLPGVFAGGDAIAGTSLLEAISTGKTAAQSILDYLKGGAA
ncbi:MAG: FAD-dependent oxidoreductase [Oscillospiraceae bacterium]|nr:FAD-dependent oxidoreductase [Oscillospiraceae bacterium]